MTFVDFSIEPFALESVIEGKSNEYRIANEQYVREKTLLTFVSSFQYCAVLYVCVY